MKTSIQIFLIVVLLVVDLGLIGPFMMSHNSYELPITYLLVHLLVVILMMVKTINYINNNKGK